MHTRTYPLNETDAIARQIIEEAGTQRIFLFVGEMGAGKTTLIKSMCRVWGVEETTSSPTFAIVHTYQGAGHRVFHFDLFRLRDGQELQAIGFEEYLDSGAPVCIEWPELAMPMLAGMPYVMLELTAPDAHTRTLRMTIHTDTNG